MKTFLMHIICFIVVVLLQYSSALANPINDQALVDKLHSSNIEERNIGLLEINKFDYEIFTTIIEIILELAHDESISRESLAIGEAGEIYETELIIALGKTHDSRAVPYLINYLGGGTLVAKSLANIGESAVDPLIEKLNHEIIGFRIAAAQAISIYLETKIKDNSLKSETKTKFKLALENELEKDRNHVPSPDAVNYDNRAREMADVRKEILHALSFISNIKAP